MKPDELMIGNYVEHNDEWCYRGEDCEIFQWENRDWYALSECTLFEENIEPISLIEEWLLKCGVYMDTCLGETSPRRFIKFQGNDNYSTEIPDYIEFVHELQNWYYWHFNKTKLTIK